ncbi:unnamed protein product, partial [Rotaria sp. Silwood2]
ESVCGQGINAYPQCEVFWGSIRQIKKENIICTLDNFYRLSLTKLGKSQHFSLANYSIVPPLFVPSSSPFLSKRALSTNVLERNQLILVSERQISLTEFPCRGGIPIYFQDYIRCLCPPILYGSFCEYQNQRVSVTLQIGAPEWRTPFVFIVYLMDYTFEIINSYHYIRYLSIRDCRKKFNFHLLYSFRPKPLHQSYSVRIDVFDMLKVKYRASWSFPIIFSFLPVNRLPIQLTVPFISASSEVTCPLKCNKGHGRCASFLYSGKYFCQCEAGWSGPLCTIPYQCNCSPDSLCVGTWKNQSICVCPTHKYGKRCYLTNDLCQEKNAKKCRNKGTCIPRDPRILVDDRTICSCSERFFGDECQLNDTRVDILIAMPVIEDSLLIHFITVNSHMPTIQYLSSNKWGPHERSTTFKRIPFDSDIVTVYWSNPFHLIFVEYDNQIYLVFIQLNYNSSAYLSIKLQPHQRCPSVDELLNRNIVNYPRLHRVKYYHIPCQERPDLECFHDSDQFICLCTHDRRANCFTFDHHMQYNCQQLSYCENNGQCFQNNAKCPTAAICACPKCYLGSRCQLSTRGFGLTLDVILGYQIRPKLAFSRQPLPLIISGVITIIMLVFGLFNAFVSIITFQQKRLRTVGCVIYLFTAAIISILTMTMFTLKYFFLVFTQLTMLRNRTFILGQCLILDFFLKILLQIGDWLYACVAIERLITQQKDVHFNNKLSQKWAKYIILFVCIIVAGTSIQEPLNRVLIDDEDEERIWCIVRYSNSYSTLLNKYTSISTVIHFICPFGINLISAFGLILLIAKNRSESEENVSFHKHLNIQFRKLKSFIISPMVLILVALPRILLAFLVECMKSARESVIIYLVGYFISFLPPILLFIVFVLPSTLYFKEFQRVMKSDWKMFRCWKFNKRIN